MSTTLTSHALEAAIDYLHLHGTDLHKARYAFHTGRADANAVMQALCGYQNEDGGFGHGLESDLRTRHSSVIATTVALQIATLIDAGRCKPVDRALAYLDSQYGHDNWPLITPDCNDAPHAPWWHYDADWWKAANFIANPGAEVISHHLTFGHRAGDMERLLTRAVDHLQQADLEMHELLCYLRLAENPRLDAGWRERLASPVFREARKLVKVEPARWEEYCLMPISVVDGPDSLLTGFFGPALDESIDWLIGQQKEDGRWAPAWSWGGEHPDIWAAVEKEISAGLTLQTLIKLDRFNRLPRAL